MIEKSTIEYDDPFYHPPGFVGYPEMNNWTLTMSEEAF